MKKIIAFIVFVSITHAITAQNVKILFDATKAESAGNADWVIDADLFNLDYPSWNNGKPVAGTSTSSESNAQMIPNPSQSNITSSTSETYWKGGLSAWGIDCVKKNYIVETLPYNGAITYGNSGNPQDLTNYKVFIVCEPNILFTMAEKQAMLQFVQNGGGLFMISDHTISDRNNDGWDSPKIWNDFLTNNGVVVNPFGISFDLQTVSGLSSNISTSTSDSLLHGPMGDVSIVKWSSGTVITINPTINSTVKASVYKTGVPQGNTNVMVAYARYGNGRVVAIGDSSPCDDGTGDTNDNLYFGYTDVSGSHQKLLMNATMWLATADQTLPVNLTSFNVKPGNGEVEINWQNETETGIKLYEIELSNNGTDYHTIESITPKNNNGRTAYSIHSSAAEIFSNAVNFFRLKTTERNEKVSYSAVKKIGMPATPFSIYLRKNLLPNNIEVVLKLSKETLVDFSIYDNAGKRTLQVTRTISVGLQSILLNIQQLQKGTYYLSAKTSEGIKTMPFVK